jgi:hypothetical protein
MAVRCLLRTAAGVETELPTVTAGSVSCDQGAAIRRTLDLTVMDDPDDPTLIDLIPDSPSALLTPYGNEIDVQRGLYYPDGTVEYVRLGMFRISAVEVADTGEALELKVTGADRAARLIDARFEDTALLQSGLNIRDVLITVLQAGYPDLPYNFASFSGVTSSITPGWNAGDDRWAWCQSLATAFGMELFFDADGTCTLRPISQASSGSVAWELSDGEDGNLLTVSRRWHREGTYNRVIATGESTDPAVAPARGVATDTTPTSPTYYFGPFGKTPRFYSSPFISTAQAAADAAAAILSGELGTTQEINFSATVNPALEVGDVVRINRERIGITDEDHVLERLTIPLSAEASMSGTTRAVEVFG